MPKSEPQPASPQYLLDYARTWGKIPFSARSFHALDALVFSQICYLPLEKAGVHLMPVTIRLLPMLLQDIKAKLPAEFMLEHQLNLLDTIARGQRFGPLLLSHFVDDVQPEQNKQFSAVTLHLPKAQALIAYRGTDLSLTGWEENFRLSFDSPVPAQRQAVDYLRQIAAETTGDLFLCGHSKGGNLAVYAAAFCGADLQHRIRRIFSFDAPGQSQGVLDTPEFQAIRKRIRSYLPEKTLVGVLLQQTRPFTVVACDAFGLLQHSPFHWKIQDGAFIKRKSLSAKSQFLDKTLDGWLDAMSRDERQQMTEAIFSVLEAPGAESFDMLSDHWFANLRTMRQAANRLPKNMKQVSRRTISLLLGSMMDVLGQDVRQATTQAAQELKQKLSDARDWFARDEEENEPPHH